MRIWSCTEHMIMSFNLFRRKLNRSVYSNSFFFRDQKNMKLKKKRYWKKYDTEKIRYWKNTILEKSRNYTRLNCLVQSSSKSNVDLLKRTSQNIKVYRTSVAKSNEQGWNTKSKYSKTEINSVFCFDIKSQYYRGFSNFSLAFYYSCA